MVSLLAPKVLHLHSHRRYVGNNIRLSNSQVLYITSSVIRSQKTAWLKNKFHIKIYKIYNSKYILSMLKLINFLN